MNELQVFNNTDFGEVRTITDGDKVLFCGSDVAKALGYDQPHKAIDRHCRYGMKHTIPHPQSPIKTIEVICIPESDIYRLVMHSKLPSAERFERWVFDEVLPTIRKHGAYATPETLERLVCDPDFGIRLLTALKDERTARQTAEAEVAELIPKAAYYDTALHSKSVIAISKIAKEYGRSAKSFNKLLHSLGIQYKQGECWLLYQKYADMGLAQLQTHVIDADKSKNGLYWTQKGRQFLHEFLKERGIMPITEGDYDEQE